MSYLVSGISRIENVVLWVERGSACIYNEEPIGGASRIEHVTDLFSLILNSLLEFVAESVTVLLHMGANMRGIQFVPPKWFFYTAGAQLPSDNVQE